MKRHFIYLVVVAVIFAASCKKDEKESDAAVVSGTILGEHANWKEVFVSFDLGKTPAAPAVPIADSKFTITLPIPKADNLGKLLDIQIPLLDEMNAKAAYATFYVRNDDQDEQLSLVSILTATTVQYAYVDKDFNLKRELTLSDEQLAPLLVLLELPVDPIGLSMNLVLDLNLKSGWNTVLNSVSLLSSTISIKDGKVPISAQWIAAKDVNLPSL